MQYNYYDSVIPISLPIFQVKYAVPSVARGEQHQKKAAFTLQFTAKAIPILSLSSVSSITSHEGLNVKKGAE